MRKNFWINKEGQNTLKGSHTNPANPVRLPDYLIADFLVNHPYSRQDFLDLKDTMLPEEQYRLEEILQKYHNLFADRKYDQEIEDGFQKHLNTARVNGGSPISPAKTKKKTLRVNR